MSNRTRKFLMLSCAGMTVVAGSCNLEKAPDPAAYERYDIVSTGTRQFEWDSDNGPGWIKVLIEEENLGSAGAEIAEIWFPPGWQGEPHPHVLEIIYVIEGELDHIVNGESHILSPGMTGIVRARDRVVHKTHSPDGVRVLVIWPLGGEIAELAASGMRESKPALQAVSSPKGPD
ncbi:MAG: cupin domain-containing protein [Gammaproteobacteria bacterium]|nr:cupin domain-containing protein [Gammaproteobacteria bacterium]MDH4315722.1 cupin domain-containing protein [Gammaproteobacteria bacterium]MDH5213444.1 cupin domain-containing protein [Gammaproteobacteria bacterium]MDH5499728.1 cupin domain-containing protein [Gammaproteobacteria bacterium]